jgi:hypothetical protein
MVLGLPKADGRRLCACALQFDAQQKTALVVYPETHEEEWSNLQELVQERCIAVGEST